jgi:hypothetical protein
VTPTPDRVHADLKTLETPSTSPDYNRGEHILAVIGARTQRRGSLYRSDLTGRTAPNLRAAREMLTEELRLLAQGLTPRAIRQTLATTERITEPPKNRPNYPVVTTLEEANSQPYDVRFLIGVPDLPTPTGRFYKTTQPVVRKPTRDGKGRVCHLQDLWLLDDGDGFVRSHTGRVKKTPNQ